MTHVRPVTRMGSVRKPLVMLVAALLFGIVGQQLFFARATGINVVVATALLLSLAWWLRPAERRPGLADAWLTAAALIFAVLCAIRTDALLLAFDASATAGLAGAAILALSGIRVTRLDVRSLLLEVTDLIGGILDRPIRLARASAGPLTRHVRVRGGRLARYAGGVALASPFLIVFSALFSSADPVYDRRVGDVLFILRDLYRDAGPRLLLMLALTWIASAGLARLGDAPWRADPRASGSRMPAETASVLLACVDLLFAVFVVFQLGYLFGGRDTLDAAGIPYSAYARRGFFELVGCAGLVGALLFGVSLLAPARSRVTAALGVVLVGLTLVVLASAWYRMALYQLAYGWTELRFYVIVGIVFLAVALLILGWAIVRDQTRHAVQPLVGVALVIAFGVNVISPSAFVARVDLQRQIDPSQLPADAERRMDASYLVSLGDGAYPVLLELLPALPPADGDVLRGRLRTIADRRSVGEPWESFNVDRARATTALGSLR